MSETSKYSIHINGSAEDVWREITKQDELQGAFFNNYLDVESLQPGQRFRMLTPSRKYAGVVGTILELEPPHRYRHTMRFTNIDEPEFTVTHEIRPLDGGGVEYTMTLDGVAAGSKSGKQAIQGMTMIARALKAIVETGRPGFGTRILHVLFKLLEPMSPASTRIEHWPTGPAGEGDRP